MFFHAPAPILLPVPHVKHARQGECLSACAFMVCHYLGMSVKYGHLRQVLGILPGFGAPFSNIERLRRQFDVEVTHKNQGSLADIYKFLQAGWPVLAGINTQELPHWAGVSTQHAVVVVGMAGNQVFINDPGFAQAPLVVTMGDFDLAWLAQDEAFAVITPA